MTARGALWLRWACLLAAFILATFVVGWTAPALGALVFAAIDGRKSAAWESALWAAVGWGLVMLAIAVTANGRAVAMIGAPLGVPAVVLPLVSMAFAAGLAWSSATLALLGRRVLLGDRGGTIAGSA